jgi:hypothetical protein
MMSIGCWAARWAGLAVLFWIGALAAWKMEKPHAVQRAPVAALADGR